MSTRHNLRRSLDRRLRGNITRPLALKLIFGAVIATLCLGSVEARAQNSALDPQVGSGPGPVPESGSSESAVSAPGSQVSDVPAANMPNHMSMGMGDDVFGHVLFNQLEGRTNGPENELRWDGEAWAGTDMNKIWFKSEGVYNQRGKMEDGIHEVLYDRPITTYFDLQGGLRYDGDSGPKRFWGALGFEGLAPDFFDLEATAYLRDAGHFAGRVVGSYDLLLTQRLIAQPEIEMNFYSRKDPFRAIGTGLTEIDTGLRIRYEITRKFAPYVGLAYDGKVGETATLTRDEGHIVHDVRFIFGIRLWY